MLVLAQRSGSLLDLDLRRFFDRFDESVEDDAPLPSLRSEGEDEIRITRERLERLRRDRDHRNQYVALLREMWSAVEEEWERQGRPATLAQAKRWTRAIHDGTPYRRLLELTRLWASRPEFDTFADVAAAAGNLILNPCWFGGKIHIIDFDGLVYVGRGIRRDPMSYRRVAAEISSNLKVLADPTRLAILLRLAREPASVTEMAHQFHLSQPTVSAHVQLLREARLLDEKTVGRSAKLRATQEGLRRLFADAEESLLELYR
jgi:DNA-binding transcriptional ArsR family regulator